jgi:hypothetical protein
MRREELNRLGERISCSSGDEVRGIVAGDLANAALNR